MEVYSRIKIRNVRRYDALYFQIALYVAQLRMQPVFERAVSPEYGTLAVGREPI